MQVQTKTQRRQERIDAILSSLDKLDFATREQLQALHNLGGVRNTNRILAELESAKLLLSKRHEQKIYYLSKRGRDRIGSEKELKATDSNIAHTLMGNELYLAYNMPTDWRTEEPVKFQTREGKKKIVPDATFSVSDRLYFAEVDRTQTMKNNRSKIELYAKLQPLIKKQYGEAPTVLFYTVSAIRAKKLRNLCEEYGVSSEVLTVMDLN